VPPEIANLSRAEKIERAVAMIGELRPDYYCHSVPSLRDVVEGRNGRIFIKRDNPLDDGDPSFHDERGELVSINYNCFGPNEEEFSAGVGVDLVTGEVRNWYGDRRGDQLMGSASYEEWKQRAETGTPESPLVSQ
jgi:hypothetical protein